MPKFKTKEGGVLDFGNKEAYNLDDEIAFILSLEKQIKSMNPQNPDHVAAFKENINEISSILNLNALPINSMWDESTQASYDYISENLDLFKKYGITEHINAKKIEKTTNPAFTETEYPPTIEEMKKLEVDIGELYNKT